MSQKDMPKDAEGAEEIIYRRFRKNPKTGKLLDARKYGLRAWPIRIRHKPPVTESEKQLLLKKE